LPQRFARRPFLIDWGLGGGGRPPVLDTVNAAMRDPFGSAYIFLLMPITFRLAFVSTPSRNTVQQTVTPVEKRWQRGTIGESSAA